MSPPTPQCSEGATRCMGRLTDKGGAGETGVTPPQLRGGYSRTPPIATDHSATQHVMDASSAALFIIRSQKFHKMRLLSVVTRWYPPPRPPPPTPRPPTSRPLLHPLPAPLGLIMLVLAVKAGTAVSETVPRPTRGCVTEGKHQLRPPFGLRFSRAVDPKCVKIHSSGPPSPLTPSSPSPHLPYPPPPPPPPPSPPHHRPIPTACHPASLPGGSKGKCRWALSKCMHQKKKSFVVLQELKAVFSFSFFLFGLFFLFFFFF